MASHSNEPPGKSTSGISHSNFEKDDKTIKDGVKKVTSKHFQKQVTQKQSKLFQKAQNDNQNAAVKLEHKIEMSEENGSNKQKGGHPFMK